MSEEGAPGMRFRGAAQSGPTMAPWVPVCHVPRTLDQRLDRAMDHAPLAVRGSSKNLSGAPSNGISSRWMRYGRSDANPRARAGPHRAERHSGAV